MVSLRIAQDFDGGSVLVTLKCAAVFITIDSSLKGTVSDIMVVWCQCLPSVFSLACFVRCLDLTVRKSVEVR